VVCDRWVTDSLVDLRLRYGSHRGAVLALRAAVPRPDLGLLLSLDAETAARRKPGDQDPAVLRRAVGLYEEEARRGALARVDARASSSEVAAEVVEQVRRLL
jgi:thymidylate kinase